MTGRQRRILEDAVKALTELGDLTDAAQLQRRIEAHLDQDFRLQRKGHR